MHEFTHLDLFSGIGGFALAAQRAGFKTVGFSEVKKAAVRKYRARFPDAKNYGDVRVPESFSELRGRVTVGSGGFPCQPWSGAGSRKGKSDDRHLGPAMCDVIDLVRPSWFIGENVPGFVGMGGFDALADALENIGYACQPFIIPACTLGAWHIRERLWIIAHSQGERCGEGRSKPDGRKQAVADGNRETGDNVPDATRERPVTARKLRPEKHAQRITSGNQTFDDYTPDAGRAGRGQLHAPTLSEAGAEGILWNDSVNASAYGFPCWNADFAEVLRMADGLSLGLDSSERNARIEALGNAIVPQVVEPFFHWIRQIETGEITDATFSL